MMNAVSIGQLNSTLSILLILGLVGSMENNVGCNSPKSDAKESTNLDTVPVAPPISNRITITDAQIGQHKLFYPNISDKLYIDVIWEGQDYSEQKEYYYYTLTIRPYKLLHINDRLETSPDIVNGIVIDGQQNPPNGETRITIDSLKSGQNRMAFDILVNSEVIPGDYKFSFNVLGRHASVGKAGLLDVDKINKDTPIIFYALKGDNNDKDISVLKSKGAYHPKCTILEKDKEINGLLNQGQWTYAGNVWIADNCASPLTLHITTADGETIGKHPIESTTDAYPFKLISKHRLDKLRVVIQQRHPSGIPCYADTITYHTLDN